MNRPKYSDGRWRPKVYPPGYTPEMISRLRRYPPCAVCWLYACQCGHVARVVRLRRELTQEVS